MDSRTTRTLVTFRRPFTLTGLGGTLPAGSYTVGPKRSGWRR